MTHTPSLPNGFSRANDNELVLHGVGSVLQALDIVISRDQWAASNWQVSE